MNTRYEFNMDVPPREAIRLLYVSKSRFGGDWNAGSTLSRQSAVPLANPCFAACGSASTNTPSTAAAAAVKKRRFLQTFILRTSQRILD